MRAVTRLETRRRCSWLWASSYGNRLPVRGYQSGGTARRIEHRSRCDRPEIATLARLGFGVPQQETRAWWTRQTASSWMPWGRTWRGSSRSRRSWTRRRRRNPTWHIAWSTRRVRPLWCPGSSWQCLGRPLSRRACPMRPCSRQLQMWHAKSCMLVRTLIFAKRKLVYKIECWLT